MSTLFCIFAVIFVGLTTLVAALEMARRDSDKRLKWWGSCLGLGTLCLLAAGAGLVLGSAYKLTQSSPLETETLFSRSPRFALLAIGSLVLLVVGLGLRAFGGRVGGIRIVWGKGVVRSSLVVALIFTFAGLAIIQLFDFPTADRWIIREIPRIELAVTPGLSRQTGVGEKYEFTEGDWFSRIRPIWEIALTNYKGKPNVRYLEIGLFEGRSALWMLDNILTDPTACLTGIDPFSDPRYLAGKTVRTYKDVFYSNLAISGFERKAKVIEGFSQIELRKLPLESFDLIYIDGSHNSSDVLEDAILCWRLLKDDGLMILDDYQLHAGLKRAVDTFFAYYAEEFQPIHVGWQVILKKRPRNRSIPGEWR